MCLAPGPLACCGSLYKTFHSGAQNKVLGLRPQRHHFVPGPLLGTTARLYLYAFPITCFVRVVLRALPFTQTEPAIGLEGL